MHSCQLQFLQKIVMTKILETDLISVFYSLQHPRNISLFHHFLKLHGIAKLWNFSSVKTLILRDKRNGDYQHRSYRRKYRNRYLLKICVSCITSSKAPGKTLWTRLTYYLQLLSVNCCLNGVMKRSFDEKGFFFPPACNPTVHKALSEKRKLMVTTGQYS